MGTTSDKLTYLNTTKGKIKDVINMTGANITSETTFRNYATKLYDGYIGVLKDKNTLLDNMPKGTSTGAITDAADLPIYEDKMSKESTQSTRILPSGYTQVDYIESSGTQYIDTGYSNYNSNSMMIDIVFSVTEFTEGGFGFYGASLINNENRRTCMLWSNAPEVLKISSGTTTSVFSEYTSSYVIGQKNRKVIYCNLNTSKYTVDDSQEYSFAGSAKNTNNICIFVPDTAVSQNFKGKLYEFKLYDNNILIRDFIPCFRKSDKKPGLYDLVNNVFYTNQGTGSFTYGSTVSIPNPDYPQEVKTVKGYRNLFDKNDTTKQLAGFVSNQVIQSYNNNTSIYIETTPGQTYTVTKKYGTSNMRMATSVVVPVLNTEILSNENLNVGLKFTYTMPQDQNYLVVFVQGSADLNTYTKEEILSGIQIVEGAEELPYVPYGTNYVYTAVSNGNDTNYYTIPLNNNEIAGIGNYKDELIIDKNGHCWLNKKTGKDIFTGIENWAIRNDVTVSGYKCYRNKSFDYSLLGDITNAYSNYFGYVTTGNVANTFRLSKVNEYAFQCVINENLASNVDDFKSWLSTHNTDVYYVLAEEQLIDLNYTVDLTLFEGVNNISNSEDMDMEIKYIKDTYE